MKKNYVFHLKSLLCAILVLLLFSDLKITAQTTLTYSYTGNVQTFVVPSCVNVITVTAKGAQGGTNSTLTVVGGLGGVATGVMSVTPGNTLNIYVGGISGYNGGGAAGICTNCAGAGGGIGGGASDIRLNGNALTDRVIVGGGGGGAGGDRIPGCGRGAGGGGGGGYYGGGGGAGWPGSTSGSTVASGGSQTAGGTGGTSTYSISNNGFPGALGVGGAAGGELGSGQGTPTQTSYVGGVGGGLVGGSGAGPFVTLWWPGQSGAGGSSYTGTLSSGSTTSGVNSGNGQVVLSYIYTGGVVSAAASTTLICIGSNVNLTSSGPVLSYTWSTGSNNSSITVVPTTNTMYVVSATNSVNCVSTSSVFITVNPGLPVLTVTSSTPQTCAGKTVTLTATGANTYTWTNNVVNGVSFTPTVTTTYVVSGQNACGTTTAATTVSIGPLPVTLVASPTIICAGYASSLISTSSATSYTWMPQNYAGLTGSLIVSPTVTTVYTVTASDGTCSGVASVTLAAKPVPTINVTSSGTAICQGDPLYLNATGGISYTWTPGNLSGASQTVNPTGATVYSVAGSNSVGCASGAATFVVTNSAPVITAQTSNALICNGSTVNLTASGASTYTWNTGTTFSLTTETPLGTTIYTVTGTLNGCNSTQTVEVDVFTPVVPITGNTVICVGSPANLTAGPADSYTWSTGSPFVGITVTPSVTTIYTLSAETTTGSLVCPSTSTVQVVVNPTPTVTAVASRTQICRNETTTITASGAPSYSWTGAATSTLQSVVVTGSIVTTLIYTVTGTNANNCQGMAVVQVKVNNCNGVAEISGGETYIKLYPNPNNGEFNLEAGSEIKLNLVNELGQLIKTIDLNSENNYKATVQGLSNGVYFVTGGKGQSINQKIIVTK